MYYLDFSKYYGLGNGIYYNIGWLAPGENYNTGYTDKEIIDKLILIAEREKVNLMRGVFPCNLEQCNGQYGSVSKQTTEGISEEGIFTSFEIWIPNMDRTKIYVAPSLIIHYIQKHNYLPPQEFIDAVNQFNLSSGWSGKDARKDCISQVFK